MPSEYKSIESLRLEAELTLADYLFENELITESAYKVEYLGSDKQALLESASRNNSSAYYYNDVHYEDFKRIWNDVYQYPSTDDVWRMFHPGQTMPARGSGYWVSRVLSKFLGTGDRKDPGVPEARRELVAKSKRERDAIESNMRAEQAKAIESGGSFDPSVFKPEHSIDGGRSRRASRTGNIERASELFNGDVYSDKTRIPERRWGSWWKRYVRSKTSVANPESGILALQKWTKHFILGYQIDNNVFFEIWYNSADSSFSIHDKYGNSIRQGDNVPTMRDALNVLFHNVARTSPKDAEVLQRRGPDLRRVNQDLEQALRGELNQAKAEAERMKDRKERMADAEKKRRFVADDPRPARKPSASSRVASAARWAANSTAADWAKEKTKSAAKGVFDSNVKAAKQAAGWAKEMGKSALRKMEDLAADLDREYDDYQRNTQEQRQERTQKRRDKEREREHYKEVLRLPAPAQSGAKAARTPRKTGGTPGRPDVINLPHVREEAQQKVEELNREIAAIDKEQAEAEKRQRVLDQLIQKARKRHQDAKQEYERYEEELDEALFDLDQYYPEGDPERPAIQRRVTTLRNKLKEATERVEKASEDINKLIGDVTRTANAPLDASPSSNRGNIAVNENEQVSFEDMMDDLLKSGPANDGDVVDLEDYSRNPLYHREANEEVERIRRQAESSPYTDRLFNAMFMDGFIQRYDETRVRDRRSFLRRALDSMKIFRGRTAPIAVPNRAVPMRMRVKGFLSGANARADFVVGYTINDIANFEIWYVQEISSDGKHQHASFHLYDVTSMKILERNIPHYRNAVQMLMLKIGPSAGKGQ